MKKLFFIISIVFTTTFFSCNHSNADKIAQVDSLLTQVKIIEDSLKIINSQILVKMINENTELVDRVQNEYKDTLTKEEMFFFYDYKRFRKTLNQLVDNKAFQQEQISSSILQLNNLKSDLVDELILQEKYPEYFALELENVNRLREATLNLVAWYKSAVVKYDYNKDGVEQILAKAKNAS